ncbi:MAG: acyltransferase [Negativicutes bacterium]|nr:acyltransferase [Negativicutes bacterium]
MTKRITAIEHIRGLAMLGVVGIHTGAYSLTNPEVNIHLFAALEIFTRFTVPIFFFVSAFGLFRQYPPDNPLDYGRYFVRRARTVLIPYLVWSLLYMARQSWLTDDWWQWSPPYIYEHFLFGLASYQLYFLVILLWFYLLMPLWRAMLPRLLEKPVQGLTLLLILQIAFNYYSSYHIHPATDNYYLRLALQHRLSYLPLHYLFIFLFGGVCALRFSDLIDFVDRHRQGVNYFFILTLGGMLGCYYWLLFFADYVPVQAVDTIHQLSPIGVLYTLAATLFLVARFTRREPTGAAALLLGSLSRYSYPVYLVHPLIMYYLIDQLAYFDLTMTVPVVLLFYVTTIAASLCFGALLETTSRFLPLLSALLSGTYPVQRKQTTNPGT